MPGEESIGGEVLCRAHSERNGKSRARGKESDPGGKKSRVSEQEWMKIRRVRNF